MTNLIAFPSPRRRGTTALTTADQIRAVFSHRALYEIASVVPEKDRVGRPRLFPTYLLLGYGVLARVYRSGARAGQELTDVVRRISLLAQKNAPLRLAFREGEVTVSAQTPDVGEASETLPVAFAGESFEIGFNPEFLRDGLESVESGDLVLKLISPLRPGLIEAADGSGFLYLIMPIRLNV